jgi:hypothetical protein
MDGQMDGWIDGWWDRWMNGWMIGWRDGRTGGLAGGRTDGHRYLLDRRLGGSRNRSGRRGKGETFCSYRNSNSDRSAV